jgi:hypothetical protein
MVPDGVLTTVGVAVGANVADGVEMLFVGEKIGVGVELIFVGVGILVAATIIFVGDGVGIGVCVAVGFIVADGDAGCVLGVIIRSVINCCWFCGRVFFDEVVANLGCGSVSNLVWFAAYELFVWVESTKKLIVPKVTTPMRRMTMSGRTTGSLSSNRSASGV